MALSEKIPALSIEQQTGIHLHLVLNEDGADPLVLQAWWDGTVNRENPNLFNVGRAAPRLRALCILFLLAKSRQSGSFLQDGVLLFQTKFKKGTWICTLANKPHDATAWVKDRFFIRESQLFFSACAGSTHNKDGTKLPSVEFKTQNLPLANLHLYVGSPNPSCKERRLLQDDELISFARNLEEKHWLDSAIEMLYPGFAAMNSRAETTGDGSAEKNKNLESALLASFAEGVLRAEVDAHTTQHKIQMDECFQALLEREVESYRKACGPFFAYIKKMSGGVTMPDPKTGPNWNQRQASLLATNAHQFCETSFLQLIHCLQNENFCKLRFVQMHFAGYRSLEQYESVSNVLSRLWVSHNPNTKLVEFGKVSAPSMIVAEFERWKSALVWGVENNNRSIAIGALMAMRVSIADFLENVCLPLDTNFGRYHSVGAYRSGHDVDDLSARLKEEINKSKDLAQSYCDYPKDFNNAWQTARQVLKSQTELWKALHRVLVSNG